MTSRRTVRALVLVCLAVFGVAAVSGIVSSFVYLPSRADDAEFADVVRAVHAVSAYLLVVVAACLAVVALLRALGHGAGAVTVVITGAVAGVVGLGLGITRGARLAWDQLALWAVTTGGNDIRGVWLRDNVKFVVRNATEVSVGDYQRDVWIHVLAGPALVVVGLGLLVVAPGVWPGRGQADASGSATNATSARS